MTPQLIVWFSSVIGAALFLMAGFLLARARAAARLEQVEATHAEAMEIIRADLRLEQENRARLAVQHQKLEEAQAASREAQPAPDSRIAELDLEVASCVRDRDEVAARVAELERERAACVEEREAAESLVTELSSRVGELKQQLEASEASRVGAEARVSELTNQRKDLEIRLNASEEARYELVGRLEEAGREAAAGRQRLEELDAADGARRELAVQVELLADQVKQLESLKERNAELESLAREVPELHRSIRSLTAEALRARSLGLIEEAPPRPIPAAEREGLGQALQALLESLSESESNRGAVLADESGLLVAGTGEHAESLAAFSAIFEDVAGRARKVLPLSVLEQMALVDENALTFTVRPFSFASGRLLLATLSVGPGPEASVIESLAEGE